VLLPHGARQALPQERLTRIPEWCCCSSIPCMSHMATQQHTKMDPEPLVLSQTPWAQVHLTLATTCEHHVLYPFGDSCCSWAETG